jgi:DNA polymerase theta
MFKRILAEPGVKALLVLPYVALVQEKVRWLRQLVQGLRPPPREDQDLGPGQLRRPDQDSIRVVGFFGGGKVRAGWEDFDIGVCTLEKVGCRTCRTLCSIAHHLSGQHAGQHGYRRLHHC